MNERILGSSGLGVSPICLGTMTFGEPVPESKAIPLVHAAIDLGINFIDTADVYEGYNRVLGSAGGVAEEIVGNALVGRRDRVVLATKVGAPIGTGPQDRGLSAAHIFRQLENSLRRLQTDYIDLYIVHWPDRFTPLETTLAALDRIVAAGKVRYVGVSNHDAAQLCELLWMADKRNQARIVSSQIPYSLLRREFHHDLEFCQRHNIGVTPYQSLQGGLLTGKYRRRENPPKGSRAAEKPAWIWDRNDTLYDKVEGIERLAGEVDLSMAKFSLAWTLAQPAMTSLVVGATRREQIEEAVFASGVTIPDELAKEVDAICAPPWKQPDPIRG